MRKMCEGPIVDLSGAPKVIKNSGLKAFFEKFWDRITSPNIGLEQDQFKVNMCPRCGDLEIRGGWQRIPHPQKPVISKEIEYGRITINGSLMICDFCVSMEKETKERRENLYIDQQANLEIFSVSPMSF